jgi:hypothetical protein
MNYSEQQLISLAHNNPKELARLLLSPNSDIKMLIYGAEILGGEVREEAIVLPVLRVLVKHVHAGVREGATMGIASFYTEKKPPLDIEDRLKIMAVSDPSPSIKEYCKTLLKDFENLDERT